MRLTRTRRYMLLRIAAKQLLPHRFTYHGPLQDGPELDDAEAVLLQWPADVRKPHVALVPDADDYPYWTKYRRFLQANDIPFEIYDIHRSSWLREAQRFDMVVWRPMSFPHELEECRRKFRILEEELGTLCYPSVAEVQLYEDKISQYELLTRHGLPVIDTFVSHSEDETIEYLARCEYPLVWKVTAGSGSAGVELVRTRRTAERWVRRVFSLAGRRTYWSYVSQKNYVYLQRFVPNADYDVRVIVVGPTVFGYYRDVPKGEFRASGMHTERHDPPSAEATCLARRVAEALDLPHVAVDMLADTTTNDLRIIEISSFPQVLPEEGFLHYGGEPGTGGSDRPDDGRVRPVRIWPQELALKHVVETRWLARARRDDGEPQ